MTSPIERGAARQPGGPDPAPRGYQLLDRLGSGGHATLWRARQEAGTGRVVALKRVSGDASAIHREAQTLAALDHPHVVQVFECVADGNGAAIAMQYAAGGSLADRLGRGPLDWREAAAVLAPIADALASAHRRGIVHRDVKPGNILFTADGHPLLSDFGIEGAAGGRGTPGYTSPVVRGGGDPTPACDVYALAVTFHVAVTAAPPGRDGPPATAEVAGAVPQRLLDTLEHALEAPAPEPLSAGDFALVLRTAAAATAQGVSTTPGAPVLTRRCGGPAHSAAPAPEPDEAPGANSMRRRRGVVMAAVPVIAGAILIATGTPFGEDETSPERSVEQQQADGGEANGAPSTERPESRRPGQQSATASPQAPEEDTQSGLVAPTMVHTDVTGDGLQDVVRVAASNVEVRPGSGGQPQRYTLGSDADQVLIGDWTCDGLATPAVYRRSTGEVFLFDAWPRSGEALPAGEVTTHHPLHGRATTSSADGCDHVEVSPSASP